MHNLAASVVTGRRLDKLAVMWQTEMSLGQGGKRVPHDEAALHILTVSGTGAYLAAARC